MKSLFRFGVAAMVVMILAGAFAPVDFRAPMAVAVAILLVAGFPLMTGTFRIAAAVFLALGSAALLWSRQPAGAWIGASVSMTNIVGIVAVMQLFAVPIKVGNYDAAIRTWLDRRFASESSLFAFTTLASHLLTSFLNLGSVPLLVSLFEDALRRRVRGYRRFFASAISRGYVLSALWSPGAVNLFLIVQATGLSWSQVFLPGFVLALLGMCLSYAMETRGRGVLGERAARSGDDGADRAPPEEPPRVDAAGARAAAAGAAESAAADGRSRALHIAAVAALFVLVMAVMEGFSIGAKSSRMVLAGALVAGGWTLTLLRRPGLAEGLKSYWRDGIMKTADIAPFFVAMGVFSGALEGSGLMGAVGAALQAAAGALGPAAVVLIGLLIVACSLVGLHPFITITLFGRILTASELPIPRLTIALGLAVGGASSYMITPFAGVIMTISKLIGAKAIDVAARWNWLFSLCFFALGTAFAFAWGALFG